MPNEKPIQPFLFKENEFQRKTQEKKVDPFKNPQVRKQGIKYLSQEELEKMKEETQDTGEKNALNKDLQKKSSDLLTKIKEFNKEWDERDKQAAKNKKIDPRAPKSIVIEEN